jgi:hypothetical protein
MDAWTRVSSIEICAKTDLSFFSARSLDVHTVLNDAKKPVLSNEFDKKCVKHE